MTLGDARQVEAPCEGNAIVGVIVGLAIALPVYAAVVAVVWWVL